MKLVDAVIMAGYNTLSLTKINQKQQAMFLIPEDRLKFFIIALLTIMIVFLFSLLVFSPEPKFNDELFIIDTTDSFAIHQNSILNQTSYYHERIARTNVEPAQPLLAVPLYWLAYHIPWIGNVHGLYLFNPIITVLIIIVFFYYALHLGYPLRVAWVAMVLLGLATILFPYTQNFMREPLTTLALLTASYAVSRWRLSIIDAAPRHGWVAAGIGAFCIAVLTKEAALITFPYYVLLAYPGWERIKTHRRLITGLSITILLLITGLILFVTFSQEQLGILSSRYNFTASVKKTVDGLSYVPIGVTGYLFSPAQSVFLYSPPLLLALSAPLILPRNRWRESWLIFGFFLWFAMFYAANRQDIWYGGASWGGRFMLPLTPFWMIAALPTINIILDSNRWWPKIVLITLTVLGVLVQFGGTYVNHITVYNAHAEITGKLFWHMLWNLRYSLAVGSLLYLPKVQTPDIIWFVPKPDWLVLFSILTGIVLLVIGLFFAFRRQVSSMVLKSLGAASVVIPLTITLVSLSRAFHSPYQRGNWEELHQLAAYLDEYAAESDIIFLTTPNNYSFFTNYFKGPQPWYTLPASPVVTYNPDQEPVLKTDNIDDMLTMSTKSIIITALSIDRERYETNTIWLAGDQSAFIPWAVRPVEGYFNLHSFPVSEVEIASNARLTRFIPWPAPLASSTPAHIVNAKFGESINLHGFDLLTIMDFDDAKDHIGAGDTIGISLLWSTDQSIEEDYTTAVYIINLSGEIVTQLDHPPQGGYAPTSMWKPGEPVRDNFGFILPSTISPGDYQIMVTVYSWPSLERLTVERPGEIGTDYLILDTFSVR